MSFPGRDLERKAEGLQRTGSDLDRKYWPALLLFGLLGLLVWFTIGEGAIHVFGRPVELRLVALFVIGSFALRTVLARQADRIRHGGDANGSAPKDL
jgi:hypothetical protein